MTISLINLIIHCNCFKRPPARYFYSFWGLLCVAELALPSDRDLLLPCYYGTWWWFILATWYFECLLQSHFLWFSTLQACSPMPKVSYSISKLSKRTLPPLSPESPYSTQLILALESHINEANLSVFPPLSLVNIMTHPVKQSYQ